MKKITISLIVLVIMFLGNACQPTQAPDLEAEKVVSQSSDEVVLEIIGMDEELTLTLEDLKDLPFVEGMAGIKSSTGKITPPGKYGGFLLEDLMELVGGLDSSMSIQVEAEDGYAMTLSGGQILDGDLITYDPGTGEENTSDGALKPMLATHFEGEPLDVRRDGNFRLVIVSDNPDQVTDGHWSVKWVKKISAKPLVEDWVLLLQGELTEEMDRGTFESGASERCHTAEWVDEKAQTWTGIPLWLLVGRVDDEVKHDDDAFNDELADEGYTVEVVAADGYSVSFGSDEVKRNDNMIVAYLVNGNPLIEKEFPLRLVGSDVDKNESIGGIAKIVLKFDEKPVEAKPTEDKQAVVTQDIPAEELGESGTLQISGLVAETKMWTIADLKEMGLVKVSLEHPKKGLQELEGIPLQSLLEIVKPDEAAKVLILTASDGYRMEVDLQAAREIKNSFIAVNDGNLSSAFPGLESSTWVKDLVAITIK